MGTVQAMKTCRTMAEKGDCATLYNPHFFITHHHLALKTRKHLPFFPYSTVSQNVFGIISYINICNFYSRSLNAKDPDIELLVPFNLGFDFFFHADLIKVDLVYESSYSFCKSQTYFSSDQ